MLKSIAILLTVYNRKETTLRCLDIINRAYSMQLIPYKLSIYLTNDGCTDGTKEAILNRNYSLPMQIIDGDGSLFWNGGMICAWNAALKSGEKYDGYLWLNDDTIIKDIFWRELTEAEDYCKKRWGKAGIYVGSLSSTDQDERLSYGGFNFVNKWTLKDDFVIPNGTLQECECAHGNLTFVSQDVVDRMGVFCDKYIHSGGDHDYTYLAHKKGFPILVLPSFAGTCRNDHFDEPDGFLTLGFRDRLNFVKTDKGHNVHNALLFQRRCFPYRYPISFVAYYIKLLMPNTYYKIYHFIRRD